MELSAIIEESESEGHTPGRLSEIRLWLAGHYAYLNSDLTEVLIRQPGLWRELRERAKSVSEADRLWEETPDGITEIKLRGTLKSIDRILSGLKTRIEILQGEARNQF
jgi:hypothetical protein